MYFYMFIDLFFKKLKKILLWRWWCLHSTALIIFFVIFSEYRCFFPLFSVLMFFHLFFHFSEKLSSEVEYFIAEDEFHYQQNLPKHKNSFSNIINWKYCNFHSQYREHWKWLISKKLLMMSLFPSMGNMTENLNLSMVTMVVIVITNMFLSMIICSKSIRQVILHLVWHTSLLYDNSIHSIFTLACVVWNSSRYGCHWNPRQNLLSLWTPWYFWQRRY
jgi:type IV secretory pathway VirB3-like protein